jgi:HlyD family secretion protein
MKNSSFLALIPALVRRRPVLSGLAALVLLALLVLALRPSKSGPASTAYFEVKRGDFTVSVVEGGTLAAVSEVSIRSEVEGTARIVYIVPEGTYAKKGDLLVELDSSQSQDQVNQQTIGFEKAKFAVEQAKATLDIQRSATNSDYLAALLKVKFAKIDLEKFEQGLRMVKLIEASNEVIQAAAQRSINLDTYSNSVKLAAKGYETKQRVDGDRLSVLNSENKLTVATNGLWMLEAFDLVKERQKYESDLLQAEQELDRVVSQNRRKMAQYEADLLTQQNTLALSEEKLKRDKRNLEACKIYAPQDGLVVYQGGNSPWSSESNIEGGAIVRNRQELIKLPDLSRMKVIIKVHESHINLVRPDLPAFVTLDSMPDQRFAGVVEKVAPLPDTQARWGNPNLKVYNTEIYVTDPLPSIKPGVSAKTEVLVTNIANAISVPIQAVTSLKGKQVVYLAHGASPEPHPVEVGMFNTKFIEITKGLKGGERVLLAPPFDTQEKDLDGAVLAADEKARIAKTNTPPSRPGNPAGDQTSAPPPQEGFQPVAASGQDRGADAVPGGGESGRRRGGGGFNREEMLKQFDKNGDGEIDETEREAARAAMMARSGGPGGRGTNAGPRFNREEMLKRFDKNGDGRLDDEEQAAMRASFGGVPGREGGQPSGGEDGGRRSRPRNGEDRP